MWPEWDTSLFFWINQGWAHPWLDFLLPLFREKLFWIPLYIFMISFLMFNFNWKRWLPWMLSIGIMMGLSDGLSSSFMKPYFERDRPCNDVTIKDDLTLRARCGAGKSFTSSHATNHFALATFFWFLLGRKRKWRYLFFLWAGLISLSQVYVGVHYPLDIICGSLLGITVGTVVYYVQDLMIKKMGKNQMV